MKSNVSDKTEINYLNWLSKSEWYDWDAACILVEVNPDLHQKSHSIHGHTYLNNQEAQQLLEIIKTWVHPAPRMSAEPYWYIDTTIREFGGIPEALLSAVQYKLELLLSGERDIFLKKYRNIAKELNQPSLNDVAVIPSDLVYLYKNFEKKLENIFDEGALGRIALFFTNEQTNQIQQLEIGEIQKIKSSHPRKVRVHFGQSFGELGLQASVSLAMKDVCASKADICKLLASFTDVIPSGKSDISNVPFSDKQLDWKENAKKIYEVISKQYSNLNREQKANKVREKMEEKRIAGESGMAKRGGKMAPSALSILRHALKDI